MWPEKTTAGLWHIIELPHWAGGKVLKMEMSSPLESFSGVMNSIRYGSSGALLHELLVRQVFSIAVGFSLIFFGTAFVLGSWLVKQPHDGRLAYLGIFAASMGTWILSEARLMQFFTDSRFLVGSISYIMQPLATASFILYVRTSVLRRYRRLMAGLAAGALGFFILNLALHLGGIASFFEAFAPALLYVGAVAVTILVLVQVEAFRHGAKEARQYSLYMGVFLVLMLVEVVVFFLGAFDWTATFLTLGIFLFFLFMAYDSLNHFNKLLAEEKEAEFHKTLALRDVLTQGGSRLAFERQIDLLEAGGKAFRLVLLDMNGLKEVNDNLGHKAGDRAIKAAFTAIEKAFGENGSCYRLSGDEFACIIEDASERHYASAYRELVDALQEAGEDLGFNLVLSSGSAVRSIEAESSFREFYQQVDRLMYEDKSAKKALAAWKGGAEG